MKTKYKIFLEAFLLTVVIFIIGLYLGIALEDSRVTKINEYQIQSEVSLMDIMNLDNIVNSVDVNCNELRQANFDLLNRVYDEALLLEKFENKQRMADKFTSLHKKYDVLRAYLWVNSIKIKEKCGNNFNTIIYLYNYSEVDLTKQAEQNVLSKMLGEIKQERDGKLLLIPFAVDTDLISLNIMLNEYNITRYPAVIINEDIVLRDLKTKEEIESYLK